MYGKVKIFSFLLACWSSPCFSVKIHNLRKLVSYEKRHLAGIKKFLVSLIKNRAFLLSVRKHELPRSLLERHFISVLRIRFTS